MFRRPGRARAEQTLKNATTQSLARPIAIPWQTSGCLDLFDLVFHDPWKLYINIVNWDFQQLVEDHYIHALRTWSEGWRKRLAALCTVPTRKTTATFPATMPRAIGSKQRWGAAVWNCETQGVWGLQKCFMCKLDQHSGSVQPVSIGLSSKSITPGWSLSGVIDWDDLLGLFGYCRAQMD